MRKFRFLCLLSLSVFSSSAYAALSAEDAQALAEKYRGLASSYTALADHYQKQAEQEKMSLQKKEGTQNKTAASKDGKAVTEAEQSRIMPASKEAQPQSPWNEDSSLSDDGNKGVGKTGVKETSQDVIPSDKNSLPPSILAENQDLKKPSIAVAKPWKGTSFGLGGSMTTGNSAATNYNATANLSYNPIIPWQNILNMNYNYARDDTKDTNAVKTNKLQVFVKTSWNFDKNNGAYVSLNYLRDQLDTYVYVLTESLGYQRLLYSNDTMNLSATTGPSLTQQKVQSSGEFSNAFGWQSGLDYVWNFTDSSSFKQSFLFNYTGSEGTTYQSNTSLSTKIYQNLTLQLSFLVNGTSWAAAGKKRVGTTTSTSLLYTF